MALVAPLALALAFALVLASQWRRRAKGSASAPPLALPSALFAWERATRAGGVLAADTGATRRIVVAVVGGDIARGIAATHVDAAGRDVVRGVLSVGVRDVRVLTVVSELVTTAIALGDLGVDAAVATGACLAAPTAVVNDVRTVLSGTTAERVAGSGPATEATGVAVRVAVVRVIVAVLVGVARDAASVAVVRVGARAATVLVRIPTASTSARSLSVIAPSLAPLPSWAWRAEHARGEPVSWWSLARPLSPSSGSLVRPSSVRL